MRTIFGEVDAKSTDMLAAEATFNRQVKLNKFVENRQLELEMKKLDEAARLEMSRTNLMGGFVGGSTLRRRQFRLQEAKNQELLQSLLVDTLAEATFEAVPYDDSFKMVNREPLLKKFNEFYENAFKGGLINFKKFSENESPFVRNIFNEHEKFIKELSETYDDDLAKELLREFNEANQPNISEISDTVADKVVKTVASEKKIAKDNQDLDELAKSEGWVDCTIRKLKGKPTLFRSILMSCGKNLSESSEEIKNENGEVVDTAPKVDQKVFAEAVALYSLLETLNTCNLINISPMNVNKLADYLLTV